MPRLYNSDSAFQSSLVGNCLFRLDRFPSPSKNQQTQQPPSSSVHSIQSVAGVIFNPEKTSVLLIQRRDVPVWVLPGGGVDLGELPQDAMVREILEETGLTVKADRLVGIYTPINRLARRTKLYECTWISGTPILSNETKGVSFFDLNNLPPLPPPYQQWIDDAKIIGPPVIKSLTSVTYSALLWNLMRHPVLVIRFLLARLGFAINS